ncbi:unnamed protein product [Rotaria sp. Silwood2]|nr:unnamed protein product [Rotaria sp. Silwood2]CAF2926968.1 unnamed protein product [Rotaria sp. Silwood2]CAF3051452.1 unnamed protein product [Rotaria sp. Silwood2]CAF3383270.1 unnamed protein product [Rotaria sp. Silwood2]CAF3917244.1 unnamed protein product [Rotaria sp. Silwood2]
MYEKPNTRLAECQNEFLEKVNKPKPPIVPPPPLPKDSVHSQPDLEYNILKEIQHVHRLIKENGQQGDFGMEMKFGELIPMYEADQIERLVEILANARRNGYINYKLNGFLQQDRDEDIYIRLVKTPF